MPKSKILLSALRKCARNLESSGTQWHGCLTPLEILAIRDLGVSCSPHDIDVAIYAKRNGIGNSRWFYFDQNEAFLKLKGEEKWL